MKIIGLLVARWVLVLTGNLEIATALQALKSLSVLPLQLKIERGVARIEYPAGPEEWAEWQRRRGLDYPGNPLDTKRQAANI